MNGNLCLWPVMSEMSDIPIVLPHPEVMTDAAAAGEGKAVFRSGPRDAWGLPGGAFEDRSSCRMAPHRV